MSPNVEDSITMKANSYSDKIDAFQTTVDNLEPDVAKYPGLADIFEQMKTLLAELRPAHGSVEAQRGNLRVAVQARRELALRGVQIHRRLSAVVGAHLGFTNPVLATYGILPQDNSRRGRRLPKKKEEATKAQPAAIGFTPPAPPAT